MFPPAENEQICGFVGLHEDIKFYGGKYGMRMGVHSGKLIATGVSILVNIGGLGNVMQGKALYEF